VRSLAATAVTPNHLTTVRLIVGLTAAACMMVGEQPWRVIGGGVFVLSVFLDRADGDLARVTGKSSPWGHTYDLIADGICNTLIFIGLGVGLTTSSLGIWAAPLGVVAGIAVASILWLVMRMEEIDGQRAAELKSFYGFDADDGILLVPIFIWMGFAQELLVVAAAVIPVVTLFFMVMYRKKQKTTGRKK